MVRNVFINDSVIQYIRNLNNEELICGLLFGQSQNGKDYVIHACVTPSLKSDEDESEDSSEKSSTRKKINAKGDALKIVDLKADLVVEHARNASRMLPGGMHVLGVFIITERDNVLSPFNASIKSMLFKLHQQLEKIKYLYGNANKEKLVLNYVISTQQLYGKTFDGEQGHVQPLELKIGGAGNAVKWQNLECRYDLDYLYHIPDSEVGWNLKKHMNLILDKICGRLENGIFLYNGECRDADELLEAVAKKKVQRKQASNTGNQKDDDSNNKSILVSIFSPCVLDDEDDENIKVYTAGGQIRMVGQVVSKIWLHPKMLMKEVAKAIVQDLLRSLSTRLEMHWDSLTEEEHSEDTNTIHEPPRRVFIPLQNVDLSVSDYLFPGEATPDLAASLKDLLGIANLDADAVEDIEGQADLQSLYTDVLLMDSDSEGGGSGGREDSDSALPGIRFPADTNKFMYTMGLAVALFVLILSLIIHFVKD